MIHLDAPSSVYAFWYDVSFEWALVPVTSSFSLSTDINVPAATGAGYLAINETRTVSVPIALDHIQEADETFEFRITSWSPRQMSSLVVFTGELSQTVVVTDPGPSNVWIATVDEPAIVERSVADAEGGPPSTTTVTLSRTNPADELTVWVDISISEGPGCCANDLEDLVAATRSHVAIEGGAVVQVADQFNVLGALISFAAGATETTFTIRAIDDSVIEGDQLVSVELWSPATSAEYYYTVGTPATTSIDLKDNDNTPQMLAALLDNLDDRITTWHTAATGNLSVNTSGIISAVIAYVASLQAKHLSMQTTATGLAEIAGAVVPVMLAAIFDPVPGDEVPVVIVGLGAIGGVVAKNLVQSNLPSMDSSLIIANITYEVVFSQNEVLQTLEQRASTYQDRKAKILSDYSANLISLEDAFCQAVQLQNDIYNNLKMEFDAVSVPILTAMMLREDAVRREYSLYYSNGQWTSDNTYFSWYVNGRSYLAEMNALDPDGAAQP